MLRRTVKLFFVYTLLGLLFASPTLAQVTFTRHTINNNLKGAYWVYAKDIDSDGDQDMVTAAFDGIDWWQNNGNQNFSKNFIGSLKGAWGAHADDIDGDGKVDILGCSPSVDEVALWRNSGSNKFTKVSIDARGQDPEIVFSADLDGDGDKDILTALWVDKNLVWYENRGGNKFNKHILDSNVPGAHSITAADFDGDGDNDIVGSGSQKTRWYENDGNGNFSPHSLGSSGGWSVFAADLDSDGDNDILRTQRNNGDVDWFENDGNGSFSEHNIESGYGQCWSVVAGDIDGDGDLDVAAAGFDANNIMVWFNNGGGSFGSGVVVDNVSMPRAVYIADMDDDGDGDITAAIRGDRDLAWYETDGTPAPQASITVTAPNGGELLNQGQSYTITWTASGSIADVAVDFSSDGGSNWSVVTAKTKNDGSYNWSVANSASGQCRIRISDAADNSPSDISDGDFTINAGPAPVVTSFSPANGSVGALVNIFGNNFNGATSVAFTTKSAGFTVLSDTEIQATVPFGAVTGPITVSSAAGVGNSNNDFVVTGSGGGNQLVFTPIDDARSKASKPSSNYGSRDKLYVTNKSYKSYLKFDVTGLNGSVLNAVLRLLVVGSSDDGGSAYLISNDYATSNAPWSEAGLTLDNAPAIAGSALSSVGPVSTGQTVEFDVTAAVSANGIISFGLQSNSKDRADYSSKEGSFIPELVVRVGSGGGGATQYNLNVNTQGSGSVSLSPTGNTHNAGSTVQLTASADAGWQFTGWSGDLSGATNPANITMASNKTVTATFTQVVPQYTLTVNTQGSGSVSLNPSGGIYAAGTIVELSATPAPGWQFSSWSGNLNGTVNSASILMSSNKNLTANFTQIVPQYTLTANTQGSGSVSLNPSGGTYAAGTVVAVTASPASGWQFSGWSGDLTGSTNPANLPMDGDKTVLATFTQNSGGGGSLTFNPLHDAQVKLTRQGSNYGTKSTTKVESGKYRSYFKFNVTGVSGSVQSALLRLYVTGSSVDGGGVYSVSNNYAGKNTPWDENGLTAANAPQVSGSPMQNVGAVSSGGYVEWDISAAVSGNGSFSFGISSNSGDQAKYYTREGTHKPELVIQTGSGGGPTQYNLTVTTQGSGTVSLSPSGNTYNAGTTVQLTATAATGWQFSGWSGDLNGSANPGNLAMDDNKSAIATFVKNSGGGNQIVLTPTDDARIKESRSGSNYGDRDALYVEKNRYDSFLKFNVTGLGGSVTSALLRLYVENDSDAGGSIYVVSNNHNTGSSWKENSVTAANAPAIGGTILDSVGPVSLKQTIEFNVTSAISGNGIISFGIRSNSNNKVGYSSKEGSVAPNLVIQTSTTAQAKVDEALLSKAEFNKSARVDVLPATYNLAQAYPNPFNAGTTIQYALPQAAQVKLFVFNIKGQLVRRLVDGFQTAGFKEIRWSGRNEQGLDVGSGLYLLRFRADGHEFTRRVVLQK